MEFDTRSPPRFGYHLGPGADSRLGSSHYYYRNDDYDVGVEGGAPAMQRMGSVFRLGIPRLLSWPSSSSFSSSLFALVVVVCP